MQRCLHLDDLNLTVVARDRVDFPRRGNGAPARAAQACEHAGAHGRREQHGDDTNPLRADAERCKGSHPGAMLVGRERMPPVTPPARSPLYSLNRGSRTGPRIASTASGSAHRTWIGIRSTVGSRARELGNICSRPL